MKKAKLIIVSLITIFSVVLMMMAGFTACPQTTTTEGTTTTTIAAALYLRGNMTDWNVSTDEVFKFTKTAANTYELTVDFSSSGINFSGRPRFKFYHANKATNAWSDDHTINGFDPSNDTGDYEFDLLGDYGNQNSPLIRTPMNDNGYVIGKVKGGMNNMSIFRDGAKIHIKVSNLTVPANPNTALKSTDTVNSYIDITVDLLTFETLVNPPDRITSNADIRLGGSFNNWNDPEELIWTITGNTATKTYWLTADAKSYEFGILNPDWGYKWGGVSFLPADVTTGTTVTKTLVAASGNNINLTVDTTGTYKFTVDFSDIYAPTLKIEKQ